MATSVFYMINRNCPNNLFYKVAYILGRKKKATSSFSLTHKLHTNKQTNKTMFGKLGSMEDEEKKEIIFFNYSSSTSEDLCVWNCIFRSSRIICCKYKRTSKSVEKGEEKK